MCVGKKKFTQIVFADDHSEFRENLRLVVEAEFGITM